MLGVAALDKARDDNLLWVEWSGSDHRLPSALASQSPLTGPSRQSWLSVFMMEELCSAQGRTPHLHSDVWNCSNHTSHQHTDCEPWGKYLVKIKTCNSVSFIWWAHALGSVTAWCDQAPTLRARWALARLEMSDLQIGIIGGEQTHYQWSDNTKCAASGAMQCGF